MVRDNEEKCSLCQQWPSHLFRIFHSMFVFFSLDTFYIYICIIFFLCCDLKIFCWFFFFCVLSSTIHTEMTGSNPMMNIHLWYYSVSHRGATQKLFETVQKFKKKIGVRLISDISEMKPLLKFFKYLSSLKCLLLSRCVC